MPDPDQDRDLQSIREARQLARAARDAQQQLEGFTQERIDEVVESMAAAGLAESERLARQAHEETGFGNVPDKTAKNDFVLRDVVAAMRGLRTVGVLRHDRDNNIFEIAEPAGVVAGIIPSTNPTSTAMFKCLIALKARCGIVLSPHPAAKGCIKAAADVMHRAAVSAGAREGIIGCMQHVSMDGTRELMNGRETDLILATGGIGLVKAAYSAGKPAYGVGPGNVPAYIERTADVAKAVQDIFDGTTFDNGTLCSSEQSIICDREIAHQVKETIGANHGHILEPDEVERLSALLITEDYLVNPKFVGRPATTIAQAAGIDVPVDTRVLVCPLDGVGKTDPLSHEKLSPVLAYYEVEDWQEGCTRCTELLRFGGLGHTLVIHSRDDDVIMQFGLKKPAHRVLVNTVAALGAVGYTTALFPSMTLGCGSWGNNITSDNIGPQHLVNVKRLAYETRPYRQARAPEAATSTAVQATGAPKAAAEAVRATGAAGGGTVPAGDHPVGATGRLGASAGADLTSRITDFLKRRGVLSGTTTCPPGAGRTSVVSLRDTRAANDVESTSSAAAAGKRDTRATTGAPTTRPGTASATVAAGDGPDPPRGRPDTLVKPLSSARPPSRASRRPQSGPAAAEFVAEEDVRKALERGEKISIGPGTILTPLARELGEQHGVFQRV